MGIAQKTLNGSYFMTLLSW